MKTVQLQSVGRVAAKPASEFKKGEFMGWNFGAKSEVVSVVSETKAFITFELKGESGNLVKRRLGKQRLVAIA